MKGLIKQLFDFAIVGIIATALDYLIFVILFNGLSWHYLLATVLAFIGSTIFNYWASIRYVFTSKYQGKEKRKEFIIFISLSIAGLILTTLLMKVSVDWIGIHANISKILVTGIVMIFNFVTRKLFIEEKPNNHSKRKEEMHD